jgi:hypothetical protein
VILYTYKNIFNIFFMKKIFFSSFLLGIFTLTPLAFSAPSGSGGVGISAHLGTFEEMCDSAFEVCGEGVPRTDIALCDETTPENTQCIIQNASQVFAPENIKKDIKIGNLVGTAMGGSGASLCGPGLSWDGTKCSLHCTFDVSDFDACNIASEENIVPSVNTVTKSCQEGFVLFEENNLCVQINLNYGKYSFQDADNFCKNTYIAGRTINPNEFKEVCNKKIINQDLSWPHTGYEKTNQYNITPTTFNMPDYGRIVGSYGDCNSYDSTWNTQRHSEIYNYPFRCVYPL